jgi:5-methylcytosine-specific restriction endonuclease McrA
MSFSKKDRRNIYDRASGYCHICHKKLAFTNYGICGSKGAWEIEHSNPKSLGGTDRLNNLYPAHIFCNRSKNNKSTRSVRLKHGKTKAPLSKAARMETKNSNSFVGALIGGTLGLFVGPWGAIAGSMLGARIGYDKNPD